ncbi:uncharacterized protein [Miscanthus floridulus]|uniref:uncharacterized protein n=1 Tax=Miscanthus floridulus TaxID=154761 RepID=UPI00345B1FEA
MRIRDDQRLAILGDPESEPKVVAKYLRVAQPRYRQLVISIKTLLDINELSIEEVTGRLKAADDGHDPSGGAGSSTACLNNTEEELVVRVVSRLQLSGTGASGGGRPPSSNQRRGRGNGAPKSHEGGGDSKSSTGSDRKKKKKLAGDECAYYGKTGHWAHECCKKKRDETAHVAQAHEEPKEGALMLGMASIHCTSSPTVQPPAKTTGQRAFFSELDTGIHGTVRFGDSSMVAIEGHSTILFECKNGEHHLLAGVYYIPKLTANIVNLGFGHLGFQGLRALSKGGMVRGLPPIDHVDQVYDSCLASKQRRCPFSTVVSGHQQKLDDRSTPMVFIGYEPGSKDYRFYNPNTERVIISRDAVFDEGRAWDWSSVSESSG